MTSLPTRWLVALLLLGVPAAAGACGGDSGDGPPEISFGRDVCTECHMIISEPRFAAAYRDAVGEPSVFDDVGDMVDHGLRAGVLSAATVWVHDYDTEKWIGAPGAWFVSNSDVATPMAGHVVAFSHRSAAQRLVGEHGGKVLRWSALVALRRGTPISTTEPGHPGH